MVDTTLSSLNIGFFLATVALSRCLDDSKCDYNSLDSGTDSSFVKPVQSRVDIFSIFIMVFCYDIPDFCDTSKGLYKGAEI